MKLKSVIFYQGVKLWDNNMYATVLSGKNGLLEEVTITIENHLVTLSCPKYPDVVIVGTSNMRCANATKEEVEVSFPEATDLEAPSAPKIVENIPVITEPGPNTGNTEKRADALSGGFDSSKYAGKPAEPVVEKPAKAPGLSKAEKLAASKKADKSK